MATATVPSGRPMPHESTLFGVNRRLPVVGVNNGGNNAQISPPGSSSSASPPQADHIPASPSSATKFFRAWSTPYGEAEQDEPLRLTIDEDTTEKPNTTDEDCESGLGESHTPPSVKKESPDSGGGSDEYRRKKRKQDLPQQLDQSWGESVPTRSPRTNALDAKQLPPVPTHQPVMSSTTTPSKSHSAAQPPAPKRTRIDDQRLSSSGVPAPSLHHLAASASLLPAVASQPSGGVGPGMAGMGSDFANLLLAASLTNSGAGTLSQQQQQQQQSQQQSAWQAMVAAEQLVMFEQLRQMQQASQQEQPLLTLTADQASDMQQFTHHLKCELTRAISTAIDSAMLRFIRQKDTGKSSATTNPLSAASTSTPSAIPPIPALAQSHSSALSDLSKLSALAAATGFNNPTWPLENLAALSQHPLQQQSKAAGVENWLKSTTAAGNNRLGAIPGLENLQQQQRAKAAAALFSGFQSSHSPKGHAILSNRQLNGGADVNSNEQTEALSLVKRKRTKVTDTRLSPRYQRLLMAASGGRPTTPNGSFLTDDRLSPIAHSQADSPPAGAPPQPSMGVFTAGIPNCPNSPSEESYNDYEGSEVADYATSTTPVTPQTSMLTPVHLRKAKLMFFFVRYPNSVTLKTFFADVQFNKNNTAQLVKWFSNFREFYYIQIEKFARQALAEGVTSARDIHILDDSDLMKTLGTHYNRNTQIEVPQNFRNVVEATVREFFRAIQAKRDEESSWKKSIYKIIQRLDETIPEYFKSQEWQNTLCD